MRVLMIGDYRTGTGPANVTYNYLNCLPKQTLKLNATGKWQRAVEIFVKTPQADVVLCSGYSKQNILALKWAKICHKRSAYLMHGCVEHENAINGVPDAEMNKVERETIRLTDAILAVSEHFANWLREHYPEYLEKIDSVPNGVDWDELQKFNINTTRNERQLISIGGGMPRKMIRYICEAIEKLNRDTGEKYTLVVIGDVGYDTKEINTYPFVRNRGIVPFDEVTRLLHASRLYIQNSSFETFGLAPLEALACGCDLLISNEVGAKEVFREMKDEDIIKDYSDSDEIAEKIINLQQRGNHARLLKNLDKESTSWEARTILLLTKLDQIREKKR
jgi:glycosyltransferase involved in cell wall biosynthesis